MASQYYLSFLILLSHNVLLHCASAAVHSHAVDNNEREADGSYRARDFEHYGDGGHNSEFDHEAILGSVKEAEEYDKLSPEESRRRLALLLPKMDINGDQHIDRMELKKWILNSFINLSKEEAEERMLEVDEDRDGMVTWQEYLQDAFGVDEEEDLGPADTGDSGMVTLVREEKEMFKAADLNGDGHLNLLEFEVFTNPEEHRPMHPHLVNQTLREKDRDSDGRIDFSEYLGDRDFGAPNLRRLEWPLSSHGSTEDKAWLVAEKDKFDHELDTNGDGVLDLLEIERWVIPDNDEIAEEEVSHLFAAADDDHDELLSFDEVLEHHHAFVGSDATDHGNYLTDHFDDEL